MSVAGKTYVFNDNLVLIGFTPFEINVRFIVNGNSLMVCDDIHSFYNDSLMYMFQLYGSQKVYSESFTPTKWDYPSLKTIRFLEDPAEGLSTLESFLSVNATENPVTNYLITDASLYQIADNLRVKTGTANPLELVDDFISEIEKLTDTRDATAVAGDMRSGKTAYVDGSKVSGNLTGKAAATYNTSSSDQTIASGQILDGVQTIKAVTTSNIDAGNIKKGVVVKVGDANSSGRINNVTGAYTGNDNLKTFTDIVFMLNNKPSIPAGGKGSVQAYCTVSSLNLVNSPEYSNYGFRKAKIYGASNNELSNCYFAISSAGIVSGNLTYIGYIYNSGTSAVTPDYMKITFIVFDG